MGPRVHQWIADVVNCVHIKPWLVNPKTDTYQSRTGNALNSVAVLFHPECIRSQARKKFEKRMEKALNHVSTLISTLTNVRGYTIEWDQSQNYHARLFLSFLQPALQSWHSTLTHLSIHVPLDLLNSFVTIKLPHLTDIHISLISGNLTLREINIRLDGFLVSLHNLKDTLTSISIQTTSSSLHLELSRFFRYLGTFPHLRAVALTIPFDGASFPWIHKRSAGSSRNTLQRSSHYP
ncbi:hypothetical protein H1R20_g7950, partial [Candolleomyces eurysporus]